MKSNKIEAPSRIQLPDWDKDACELHHITAEFVDAGIEQDYRNKYLPQQKRRGMALALVVAVLPALNLVHEIKPFIDGDQGVTIIIARLLVFLCSLAMIVFLWRSQSQRHVERLLFVYSLFISVITVKIVAYHPEAGFIAPTTLVATIALIYFFAPLQFVATAGVAMGLAVGGWVGWVVVRGAATPDDAYRLTLWLASVTVIGLIGCYGQHRTLRALFWERIQLVRQQTLLESAYQREHRALEQFKQFAELISHEFRNPLAIVKNKAQLLHLVLESGHQADPESLAVIERAADRLDALFRQWLKSDGLSDETIKLELRDVTVRDLLRLVTDQLSLPPSLLVEIVDNAPDARVRIDPLLMCTALENIIDNSVKYSPQGGGIKVEVHAEHDSVVIVIADQGIGIAPENLDRLCEKYFRVSHDSGVRGFGLGLWLVHQIVEMHGGSLNLESRLGEGVTVRIRLARLVS